MTEAQAEFETRAFDAAERRVQWSRRDKHDLQTYFRVKRRAAGDAQRRAAARGTKVERRNWSISGDSNFKRQGSN